MDYHAIVRLFINKQREFARFAMAASSQDEVVGGRDETTRGMGQEKNQARHGGKEFTGGMTGSIRGDPERAQ